MKNIKEILFDENRDTTLILTDGAGRDLRFEQVYVTEREGVVCCILRPLTIVKGFDMQSAIVFTVDAAGTFRAVKEMALSEAVFSEYYEAVLKMRGED